MFFIVLIVAGLDGVPSVISLTRTKAKRVPKTNNVILFYPLQGQHSVLFVAS